VGKNKSRNSKPKTNTQNVSVTGHGYVIGNSKSLCPTKLKVIDSPDLPARGSQAGSGKYEAGGHTAYASEVLSINDPSQSKIITA